MSAALRRAVWARVCRHLDGIAIGTTVAALHRAGVLVALSGADGVSPRQLCERFGANSGFLQVALRLLACQGWLVPRGEPGGPVDAYAPTPSGRAALALGSAYEEAAGLLPLAGRLEALLTGEGAPEDADALARACGRMRDGWDLPVKGLPAATRVQVQDHLDGHVAGPVMASLTRGGLLSRESSGADLAAAGHGATRVLGPLAPLGWATVAGTEATLTPSGRAAAGFARQYWAPLAYLETLEQVPALLFGDCEAVLSRRRGSGGERHVDRALDIRFSGEVATRTCRGPVLEVALPLFDRAPVERQPSVLVDVGCGDGALARMLHEAVSERTLRGPLLAERPLTVVAADPSPVAREAAAATLEAARIPHRVVDCDVADPDGLAETVRGLGLDPEDALHVSKSVIHNRPYRGALPGVLNGTARSSGAFATPDGAHVPGAALVRDLVAHLEGWRPLARRHGLLVVEAHTAPPETAARLLGRAPLTALDATHGYSCQYLVEAEVFEEAARAAGFRSAAHREIGRAELGYTALTVDHLVV